MMAYGDYIDVYNDGGIVFGSYAENGRDLSRAEFMRSVGTLVFSRTMDQLHADGEVVVPDSATMSAWARREEREKNIDPMWYQAHALIYGIYENRTFSAQSYYEIPEKARYGIQRYTHYGYHSGIMAVLDEGIKAQTHFPLNIAQIVSMEAARRGEAGYAIDNHADIATMLRRPDFRNLIRTSLHTNNGVWGQLSFGKSISLDIWAVNDMSPMNDLARMVAGELEFTDNGVDFSSDFKADLLKRLAEVNKVGVSDKINLSKRASSGCPIMHDRPHFTKAPDSQQALAELTTHYGITIEEATAKRETSVVDDGLDFMATILDNFDAYRYGELTTYTKPTSTSSAQ